MTRIILIFGIIAGIICGSMFFIFHPSDGKMDFENGMLKGYITMTLALSSIFFAVKQYRDKYNEGSINFLKAFLIGIALTLVSGIVYSLLWELYYQNYAMDFADQYLDYIKEQMEAKGMAANEIAEKVRATEKDFESYTKNPFLRFLFTMLELLPIGIIISLLSAVYWTKIKKNNYTSLTASTN
jgi:hypothetical protein